MNAHIIFHRKREICAEGRIVCLILDELLLCRKWDFIERRRCTEPAGVKAVVPRENLSHFIEASPYVHAAYSTSNMWSQIAVWPDLRQIFRDRYPSQFESDRRLQRIFPARRRSRIARVTVGRNPPHR